MLAVTYPELNQPVMGQQPEQAPPAFHLLAKPTGAACNLDCAYCFFLDKEVFYPGSKFRMSELVLEQYIRQLIESHQTKSVNIAWQGGEPTLMGLGFYRRTMDLVEKYRRPGMTFLHTMQTNGTLLDDEWGEFFAQHNFLDGISIDGPQPLHDIYRGQGRRADLDKVMRLRCCRNMASISTYSPLSTAPMPTSRWRSTASCATRRRDLDAVHPGGGTYQRRWADFIPTRNVVSERSVLPRQFGRFLCTIFDEWVRHDAGTIFVQTFEATLRNWLGLGASGMCVFNETCGAGLAIEHNGDLYSCDHFVEPACRLGNIQKRHMIELVSSPAQIKFGQDKRHAA